MLIIKGDTVLDVTPKAYEVIYKDHDFAVKEEEILPSRVRGDFGLNSAKGGDRCLMVQQRGR